MKIIGSQWDIVKKLKEFNSTQSSEDWKISYVGPVYGGWDMLIECYFKDLDDLDKIVSFCRTDQELQSWIEATTTLVSTKRNYKAKG